MFGLGNTVRTGEHDPTTYDRIHAAFVAAGTEVGACVAASPTRIDYVSASLRPGGVAQCTAYPDAVELPCCARALAKIQLPPGDYSYFTRYDVSR